MELPVIIQKYGGSSVATIEQIRKIAEKIIQRKNAGNHMVIVVSARGSYTSELLAEAKELTGQKPLYLREADMLLSAGERISIALLSIALNSLGCKSTSLTGSQCGIITDANHTSASILEIRPDRILQELDMDRVVIVAGFQGVSTEKEVTTLGRGGSDLTAIALGIALKAKQVEILSDVDGIYNSNPSEHSSAELLDNVTPAELVDMAASGARIIDLSGAKVWQKYAGKDTVLKIAGSHGNGTGTIVTTGNMSRNCVSSVSTIKNAVLARVSHANKGIVLSRLRDYNLVPAMMFRSVRKEDGTSLSFVFEGEKSELPISQIRQYCTGVDCGYSVVSAAGLNIGVDMEVVCRWEEVSDRYPSILSTVYSANRISTCIHNSEFAPMRDHVFSSFLSGSPEGI